MEQGFTVDMGYGDGPMAFKYASRWAPGTPMKSFLRGIRWPARIVPIGTYRCTACGYLESYAGLEFAPTPRRQFSLRALFYLMTAVAVILGLLYGLFRR
jgi:hypothetical protein